MVLVGKIVSYYHDEHEVEKQDHVMDRDDQVRNI
jgi:hypothetical protein